MKKFSHYLAEAYQHQYRPAVGDTVSFQINEELEIVAEVDELTEDGVVLNLDETALGLMTGLALIEDSTVTSGNWTLRNERDDEEDKTNWFHYLSGSIEDTPNREMNAKDLENYLTKHQLVRNIYEQDTQCPACGSSNVETEKRNYGSDSETGYQDSDDYIVCKDCGAEEIAEQTHSLTEAEYQGRSVELGKPMRTPGGPKKFSVYVRNPKTGNVKKVNFGDPNMEIKRDDPKRRKNFRARHGCGTGRASDRTKAAYWSCKMWSTEPISKIVKEYNEKPYHLMTADERTALRIKQNRESDLKTKSDAGIEDQKNKEIWKDKLNTVTQCEIYINIVFNKYLDKHFPDQEVYAKLENEYFCIAKPQLVDSADHDELRSLGYKRVTVSGTRPGFPSTGKRISATLKNVLRNGFELGGRYTLSEKPEQDDYEIKFKATYNSTVNPSRHDPKKLPEKAFTVVPVNFTY